MCGEAVVRVPCDMWAGKGCGHRSKKHQVKSTDVSRELASWPGKGAVGRQARCSNLALPCCP